MKPQAVVAGAGLAGLGSAISLAQNGWKVTVLERSATLQEVGAGFAMSRNAVAAFRGLGFDDDAVTALGALTWASGTWTAQGKPLMTVQQSPSTQLIRVHRRRLHQMLLSRANDLGVEIITESPVHTLEPGAPGAGPAEVSGRTADLVIAADNGLMRLMPAAVVNRAAKSVMDWTPPAPASPVGRPQLDL